MKVKTTLSLPASTSSKTTEAVLSKVVKVAEPNKWDLKSRVVYREHYGKIPDGYTIIYLDGNGNKNKEESFLGKLFK